jgi:DNA-binding transcriptional LysR family regulator
VGIPGGWAAGGYQVKGNLTISDTLFSVDAALEGVGLAYTFEQLARPHIRSKRLKRVLASFSPTFPGFYLYYPSRHDQPTKLKALIEYVSPRRSSAPASHARSTSGHPSD